MIESGILRPLSTLTVTLSFFVLVASTLHAQQPFVTDDADVTPKGRFHFEFSNEFDLLQKSAFPSLKQNTADFELAYGLFESVELAVAAPLLTIFNVAGTNPKTATGIGDMAVYYQFKNNISFDFGVIAGKYDASPRAGAQLGISVDF